MGCEQGCEQWNYFYQKVIKWKSNKMEDTEIFLLVLLGACVVAYFMLESYFPKEPEDHDIGRQPRRSNASMTPMMRPAASVVAAPSLVDATVSVPLLSSATPTVVSPQSTSVRAAPLSSATPTAISPQSTSIRAALLRAAELREREKEISALSDPFKGIDVF